MGESRRYITHIHNQNSNLTAIKLTVNSKTSLYRIMNPSSEYFDSLGNVINYNILDLDLSNHGLTEIPKNLSKFKNLETLNLSKNQIKLSLLDIGRLLAAPKSLKNLILHSNQISSDSNITKYEFFALKNNFPNLQKLDISNNQITNLENFTIFESLNLLQASGNKIRQIPTSIKKLTHLEYLYLGNNQLEIINPALSLLSNLKLLALNNNKIYRIPEILTNLTNLRTLHLHYNEIAVIPAGLVKSDGNNCINVQEITLRGNPLLDKFVKSRLLAGIKHKPPSLFEFACRSIKENKVSYQKEKLPPHIADHLECAVKCSNPRCSGVYFESKYLQVKFVDCCGAYKLPLLQYLCRPGCVEDSRSRTVSSSSSSSVDSEREFDQEDVDYYHRRVVLTGVDERFSGFD